MHSLLQRGFYMEPYAPARRKVGANIPRKLSVAFPHTAVISPAMPHTRIGLMCLSLLLAVLAGCSTAPIADMLDFFKPGRLEPATTPPYGGVCTPRPVGPPAPLPSTLSAPALPAAPGALPGPAPTPLGAPPGALPAPAWPEPAAPLPAQISPISPTGTSPTKPVPLGVPASGTPAPF
jgi:hypothetical protein